MTNWDLYNLANYIVGKHPSGNAFNSTEFEQQFNYCQVLYQKKMLGLPEEYQPLNPISRYGYGLTGKLNTDIEKFVVTLGENYSSPLKFVNGFSSIPSDMVQFISMSHNVKENDKIYTIVIELVNKGEFVIRNSSELKHPDFYNPIVTAFDGKFSMRPTNLINVNFSYIRYPNNIDISTSINPTTGEEEYNSSLSTESEWSESNNYDILSIMLQKVGINIRSSDVMQFAMNQESKGV